jgi:hydroxyacylglutathione hydrolase
MGRLGKLLLVFVVLAALLGGGVVLAMRAARGKVGSVSEVRPDFLQVTNGAIVSVFAARVAPGPHVIFFDTGFDPEGKPIDALLAALQATRDDVTDVFLTHGHFDHIAGAKFLPKAHVYLGAGDVPMATGKARPAAFVPMLLGLAMPLPPITVTTPLTSAASLSVGDKKTVKAIPVPGHTPGSYAYLYDGVLIVGDIMVLKDGRLETTPRLANPDPEANNASIRSLKTALMGDTIDMVCTSHGGCTPKGLGRNLLDDLISRVGG